MPERKGSSLKCLVCQTAFYVRPSKSDRKYCSRQCFWVAYPTHPPEIRSKFAKSLLGHSVTEKTRKKIIEAQKGKPRPQTTGEGNGMWKGQEASYSAIHHWIKRILGVPKECSQCGHTGEKERLEWANRDHTYRRVPSDWLPLCRLCHEKFDRQNGFK